MGTYIPPGWPAGVHPPGSEEFESTAVGWLLDVVPPDYRLHGVLRRYPIALATMARHHSKACVEGAREGYRTARTELAGALPPHAVDTVLAAYRKEGARLAETARAVDLVERALRGEVFTPKMSLPPLAAESEDAGPMGAEPKAAERRPAGPRAAGARSARAKATEQEAAEQEAAERQPVRARAAAAETAGAETAGAKEAERRTAERGPGGAEVAEKKAERRAAERGPGGAKVAEKKAAAAKETTAKEAAVERGRAGGRRNSAGRESSDLART